MVMERTQKVKNLGVVYFETFQVSCNNKLRHLQDSVLSATMHSAQGNFVWPENLKKICRIFPGIC